MNGDLANLKMVDEKSFEQEVLRVAEPTLVAFGSNWSKPCQVLLSVLTEVQACCRGKLRVVRVNADDNPDLDAWYGIDSVPTLLCFVNGQVSARIVGAVSAQAILSRLKPLQCEAGQDGSSSKAGAGIGAYDAEI
ncbi:MAG TPA: thioredoxin domain-containing protein [Clostridia bacterium]|nr:thioredoxin domain-containing protein [Clostridia bacterium]